MDKNKIFEIFDQKFHSIININSRLEKLPGNFSFTEGPCWDKRNERLIFSDIPNNTIFEWSESKGTITLRNPSGHANGNAIDNEGRLISCLTSERKVIRLEHNGDVTILADSYNGKRLTSPNDVVVKSDNSIWFTDPDYGFLETELGHGKAPEQNRNRVYRIEPKSKDITIISEDFDKPNGICFSKNENKLFVSDTGRTHGEFRNHNIVVFDLMKDTVQNPSIFAKVEPYVPDGIKVDDNNNLWTSSGSGVQIYDENKNLLGKINTPEVCANLCFGMKNNKTLFITATSSVWKLNLI
ncbi:MAG: gluconolactonase [Chloroflexi bacterium]|nr:gluconolactonase [Chloroflexota bacterium]|tara:strand:- start:5800 stop:6690 length:891 start_codon:yes stop_codon:yes gene_type:complete